jgi:hypothetical protein
VTPRAGHLTESEFIDLLDGALPSGRRAHLENCGPCAQHAAELAASAAGAQELEVPEPPPFFWTQLSARVSEAVANEAAKPSLLRWHGRPAAWLALAAAAILIALVFLPRMRSDRVALPDVVAVSEPGPAELHPDDAINLDDDEAWAVVRTLAADLDDEQMGDEGVSAGVGAIEHLTLQLNEAERIELARLLQEQLSQGANRESAS